MQNVGRKVPKGRQVHELTRLPVVLSGLKTTRRNLLHGLAPVAITYRHFVTQSHSNCRRQSFALTHCLIAQESLHSVGQSPSRLPGPGRKAGPGKLLGRWPEFRTGKFRIVGHDQVGRKISRKLCTPLSNIPPKFSEAKHAKTCYRSEFTRNGRIGNDQHV